MTYPPPSDDPRLNTDDGWLPDPVAIDHFGDIIDAAYRSRREFTRQPGPPIPGTSLRGYPPQPAVLQVATDFWDRIMAATPGAGVAYVFRYPHPQIFRMEVRHDPALEPGTLRVEAWS